MYPMDTLKTFIQNHSSPLTFGQAIVARKGFYFQGLGPTLALSVPATGVYLSIYDKAKSYFATEYALHRNGFACATLSGIIAETCSCLFFVPMEVIKEKLQVNSKISSAASMISTIYQKHGLYGFYRGFFLTVYLPYSVTYFVSYEHIKAAALTIPSYNDRENLPFVANLGIAGLCAGFASAITNPLDIVHTRVQVETNASTWKVIRNLYTNEGGFRAFGKGLIPRVLW
jgi:hypothetical protein